MKYLVLAIALLSVGCPKPSSIKNAQTSVEYAKALDKCFNDAVWAYEDGGSFVAVNRIFDNCAAKADAEFGRK